MPMALSVNQRPHKRNSLRWLYGLLLLFLLGWAALNIQAAPLPAYPPNPQPLPTMSLPAGLPAPVQRFYQQLYGDQVPIITSAVISGKAQLRIMGITFPARFRFVHQAGKNYRHYLETTLFGLPFLKVNESYLDGQARLELPFGITQGEAKINQAANLGLWAEAIWFPAILLSDPRVRWEPVDNHTALLVVPFGEQSQLFVVRFNPDSGMVQYFESMRYREANSPSPSLWINQALSWERLNGWLLPKQTAVTWFEEGQPWAVFDTLEVVFNSNVEQYILGKGY